MNTENNKKRYKKPTVSSSCELAGIVPLAAVGAAASAIASSSIGPAAALLGGYAVGRGVKQAMEGRIEMQERNLLCVIE